MRGTRVEGTYRHTRVYVERGEQIMGIIKVRILFVGWANSTNASIWRGQRKSIKPPHTALVEMSY